MVGICALARHLDLQHGCDQQREGRQALGLQDGARDSAFGVGHISTSPVALTRDSSAMPPCCDYTRAGNEYN